MGRPVAWLRELPRLRSELERSRVETWARRDVERLFSVGRVQAQALMKAVGGIQAVAGAHFLERASLLALLDELIQAPEPEQLLRERILGAEPAPRPKPLRISLPPNLRTAMLPELPPNVRLAPGRIEITALTAERMAESLYAIAFVFQNDLRWAEIIEPPPAQPPVKDDELEGWLEGLRTRHAGSSSGTPDPERG